MDALELLRNVSDAYRAISTLEIEAVTINESGDENANTRSEQRLRFVYASPNRLRYEPLGRHAMIQIADGTHLHTTFPRHGFESGPRFSSIPEVHGLPHFFRPDFLLSNDATFVFQRIEERVVNARILQQEAGCHVVAVAYDVPPHPGVGTSREILSG